MEENSKIANHAMKRKMRLSFQQQKVKGIGHLFQMKANNFEYSQTVTSILFLVLIFLLLVCLYIENTRNISHSNKNISFNGSNPYSPHFLII